MPASTNQIMIRAGELSGIKPLTQPNLYPNDVDSVFTKLLDIIRDLNNQSNIPFDSEVITKNVQSSSLTFKPVQVGEVEPVDETDRILSFIPNSCPVVYADSTKLFQVSFVDVVGMPTERDAYAFVPSFDSAKLIFGCTQNGRALKIAVNKPIELPTQPSSILKIPESYHQYIINKLALEITKTIGDVELIPMLTQSTKTLYDNLTSKNNSTKPSYANPQIAMNRFF